MRDPFSDCGSLIVAVIAGIVLAPLLRIALYLLWPAHTVSWVVLMPCRADALLLGVLAAIAIRDHYHRLLRFRPALPFLLALLACGVLFLTVKASDPYRFGMLSFGFTWLALFYCATLLCALLYPDALLARCLRWRWLGWLGSIAYGTYLLHEFVRSFFFSAMWTGLPEGMSFVTVCISLLALAATLAVCAISWRVFEKPLVDLGHRVRYQPAKALASTQGVQG